MRINRLHMHRIQAFASPTGGPTTHLKIGLPFHPDMTRVASLVGVFLILTGGGIATQRVQSALFNAGAEGYIGSIYDEPPTGNPRYVYYAGETVHGSIRLLNADEGANISVTVPRERPIESVWLETPDGAPPLRVADALYLDIRGARSVTEFDRQVHVPARGQVVLTFDVPTTGLASGVYRVRFKPRSWESDRPILGDYDVFSFELRERRELVQRLEALYREVRKAIQDLDMQGAERGVDQMLAAYPDSALAYALKGEIARRLGRDSDAALAEQRAKELINAGKDRFHVARAFLR